MKNEINGYSLFNDIEDKELRTRNRAVVLANMAEANTKGNKISNKGAFLVLSYFDKVPKEEQQICLEVFEKTMKDRGYVTSNQK
jgi:hypothetical protein